MVGTTSDGRLTAAAGLVYVIAWVIGLLISPSSPAPTASTGEITTYLVGNRGAVMIQTYLIDGVAAVALIVFAADLRSVVRRFDEGVWPSVLIGAAVAAASVSLVLGIFGQVLANHIAATGDAGAIRALLQLDTEADTYKLLPLGAFVAATSIVVLRTGALTRWIGCAGGVLAPVLVIVGWSFPLNGSILTTALAVSLVGLLLWVASVSPLGLVSPPSIRDLGR